MTHASPANRQDNSPAGSNSTGAARRSDWPPILLRFKDGPLVASVWGSGDPDTIPEEYFELPEQVDDWNGEEILGPPPGAEDEAGVLASVAKSVPTRGELPPPRPPAPNRFTPLTLKEMADLPAPEWMIDGLVPQDGLVVLYGVPAAGKSFLALDWALSVATGVPWLGREVREGEVVYIYAEGARGSRGELMLGFRSMARRKHPRFGRCRSPCQSLIPVSVPISSKPSDRRVSSLG